MKTVFALCLLFAAANAFSLDALKRMLEEELDKREEPKQEVTLQEYLRSQAKPDPLFRSLSRRDEVDCATVCGAPATVDATTTCDSTRWVPDYQKVGECECLAKYRCCPATCAADTDVEICWGDQQKGLKYGIEEVDCCGCQVVKCLDCAPVTTAEVLCSKAKPEKCYTYDATSAHQPKTACWEASCPENQSDAPKNEVCDTSCERSVSMTSDCGFGYSVCQGSKMIESCQLRTQEANRPALPLNCYSTPDEVDDPSNGKWYEAASDSCKSCKKWTYDQLSCDGQNAAVDAADCHQVGAREFDQKCMRKDVNADECGCKTHVCELDHSEPEAKFGAGEVCPKDHVKKAGISICGAARDICLPCPPVTTPVCEKYTKLMDAADDNGCPSKVCQPASVEADCLSDEFKYNALTNRFECQPPAPAPTA